MTLAFTAFSKIKKKNFSVVNAGFDSEVFYTICIFSFLK